MTAIDGPVAVSMFSRVRRFCMFNVSPRTMVYRSNRRPHSYSPGEYVMTETRDGIYYQNSFYEGK